MKNQIFGDKKALSTVLTTMIILVASVILAVSVGTFGSSLFQSSTAQESVKIDNIQQWVEQASGLTNNTAAFIVTNSGDSSTEVKSISIRGNQTPLARVYIYRLASTEVVSGNLQVPGPSLAGGAASYSISTPLNPTVDKTYNRADASFSIAPRESVIIYVDRPDLDAKDIGGKTTLVVRTSGAVLAEQATVLKNVAA